MKDPEFIVVCIDNSELAYLGGTYESQIEAVKFYCKTKLEANSETEVTLFTMGSSEFSMVQPATSDFKKILNGVSRITPGAGFLWFRSTLSHGVSMAFCRCPPNKQKRMLFLVGGLVDLSRKNAKVLGSDLNRLGIAVDVVTFCLGENAEDMTMRPNQYGKMELNAFVRHAKSNDNSHIRHLDSLSFSSIWQDLSQFILRVPAPAPPPPHPTCTSRKTTYRKKAKGKNHAAGQNKHVRSEASSLENERVKLGKRNVFSLFKSFQCLSRLLNG